MDQQPAGQAGPESAGTALPVEPLIPALPPPLPPALPPALPSKSPPPASPPPPRRGLRRRVPALFRRLPHPPLRSKRGLLILLLLFGGFGSVITVGSVIAITWTETADFCGRCHTMGPELKAYAISPHREVPCAECHVEPGIGGWVKAKITGTKQLIDILSGSFPTPIKAPDHADLPPTSQTCVRCHDVHQLVADGGPVKLVLGARFRSDEANTRDTIALVLRPAGFGGSTATRGVHWHIESQVDFTSTDPRAQTIDWVGITLLDGTKEQFVSLTAVSSSSDAQPDIDRLKAAGPVRRMSCIDCHNRVGHGILSPDQAIDESLAAGRIDQSLPFIKQQASALLSVDYASAQDADKAIQGLSAFYAAKYPLVPALKGFALNSAIVDLERIYRLVATPEMRVTGTTYPNNLGHQASPGCFRCHDGAHYKVVNGALTQEAIPSACATCHTFPQIGATESGVLIGQRPDSHSNPLWVFNHKTSVTSLDPSAATCGACHTRTYCENCHSTQAVQVPHDDMVYNHAAVIKKTGAQACAYCHQPSYCAPCHANPVMPTTVGGTTPTPTPIATLPPPPSILPTPSPSPSISP